MPQSPPAGRYPHARRSPRFTFDALVGLIVGQPDKPQQFWSRSTDISQGGIGVNLIGADLKLDQLVSLQIPMPKSLSAGLRASVRYRVGLRCGLAFVDMDENQKSTLRLTCEALANSQSTSSGPQLDPESPRK